MGYEGNLALIFCPERVNIKKITWSRLAGDTFHSLSQIQEFLRRGGMTEVYNVWDTQRMTSLVMKVLLKDLALDGAFARIFIYQIMHISKFQPY